MCYVLHLHAVHSASAAAGEKDFSLASNGSEFPKKENSKIPNKCTIHNNNTQYLPSQREGGDLERRRTISANEDHRILGEQRIVDKAKWQVIIKCIMFHSSASEQLAGTSGT